MDISSLVEVKKNTQIPEIRPGDTVKVSAKIVEGGKERIQAFQGVVLKVKRGGNGASFTVRHVAFGIGVERTFPFNSPLVEKVELIRQGKVRRSRLYYLRGLSGKEARRKIKRVERKAKQIGEELLQPQPEEEMDVMPAAETAAVETAPAVAAAPEAKKAIEAAPAAKPEPATAAAPEPKPAAAPEPTAMEKKEEPAPKEEKPNA